ncbi:MAG: hypothetical protein NTY38_21760 [Acidobacteria bacterium]|nr:hypothetical protein [Acidobacteriota bacterium]
MHLEAQGLQAGDQLVWAFGGSQAQRDIRWRWDPTMRGNPAVYKLGDPRKPEAGLAFDAASCRGNQPRIEGALFHLGTATGACSRAGQLRAADASAVPDPAQLAHSTAAELPMVCGVVPLAAGADELFWTVQAPALTASPRHAFEQGVQYLQSIERVQATTPDPRLDAALASVCHPIDAAFERSPARFLHGCMAFSIPFLGWRVLSGATALGWHQRVTATALYYAPLQVKDAAGHTEAHADPRRLSCIEGADSRFWGRGRLAPALHHMYDTQTQFFDQLIREWRWTADPELERILRPALELHLEWARDCFDPDGDGLYESYINTLPTDSVWYNGGGSVEESAYIYYAHLAARDMARRAEDEPAAHRHQQQADKIRRALDEILWLDDRGHYGLYREQGGHRRVHTDAWVYSQFLPIDAGMATPEQAIKALHYTEWALERIRLPFGGEICQPSNWVPWKWSVRDVFGGDVCALALAYFQTGLADQGWQLLLGAMLESAYASGVPGGFRHIGAGTDFSDNTHMFARTVVEGLFGYQPDYPAGVVRIHPAFPTDWEHASIRTPDFSLQYQRRQEADRYHVTLTRPARLDFRLPVSARDVPRVTLNGRPAQWTAEPGFGCTWIRISTAEVAEADLVITIEGRLPHTTPVHVDSLQGAAGHHLVLKPVTVGRLPQHHIFKVRTAAPEPQLSTPREAPAGARWKCLPLEPVFNGDVRTIFGQRYVSPRPATCSVRLGDDGYSAWTFPFWKEVPPAIDLAHLPRLRDAQGRILTPQRVPFAGLSPERNIAFTSLWDNWPGTVTVPVQLRAEWAWLLVCGTTFPMQTRIANAEFRFRYADGQVEKLELMPPLNFWSLCPWGGGDYDPKLDAFCLPPLPPPQVQLGNNCRAMVLPWKLRPDVPLADITLETLSQDVVIGLMGVSLMNPVP